MTNFVGRKRRSVAEAGEIIKLVDYSTGDKSQWDDGRQCSSPDFMPVCDPADVGLSKRGTMTVAQNFAGMPWSAAIALPDDSSCVHTKVACEGLHGMDEEGLPDESGLREGETLYYGYSIYVASGQSLPAADWGLVIAQWNYPGWSGYPVGLAFLKSHTWPAVGSPLVTIHVSSGEWTLNNPNGYDFAYFSGYPRGGDYSPSNIDNGPLNIIPHTMFAYDTWFQTITMVKWSRYGDLETGDSSQWGQVQGWARTLGGAWINTVPFSTGFATLQHDALVLPTPFANRFVDKAGGYTSRDNGFTQAFTLRHAFPLVKGTSFDVVSEVMDV